MQWWNDFVDWFYSEDGQRILVSVVIPFVAIVVAGFVAALIGRGATRRLVAQRDHETRAAAVTALISAGQNAARWHSQSPAAREHAEHLANDADVMVRLLPISGASYAADWASHQLADMRVNSVSFSYQADQTLAEYRERLVLWLHKPNKGRKLFAADLERWRYEEQGTDPVILEQQQWAEDQYTAATDQKVPHEPLVEPAESTAVMPKAIAPEDRYSAPVAPTVTTAPPSTAPTTDEPASDSSR
jgi:type II secretory pathway pseudopilin PulG